MKNNIQISIIACSMLIALKLDGVIECTWFWAISPLWLSYIVSCIVEIILSIWLKIIDYKDYSKACKNLKNYGKPTHWDAKSGRIYGDFDIIDAETE